MKNVYLTFLIFLYSLNAQSQIFVNNNATGTADGSSWTDAYTDLQIAINASVTGDEIWVAEGTYTPNSYPTGCTNCSSPRNYSFLLKDGVAIYGGFTGTETLLSERDWEINSTILSGDIDGTPDVVSGSGVTLNITGNQDNAYHVILSMNNGATTILDGFRIAGGNASVNSDMEINGYNVSNQQGAGMYNYLSSAILRNLVFSGNNASNQGGGIYNDSASPTMTGMTFSLNNANDDGGGIYNNSASPTISNSIFTGNRTNTGGGIYNYFSAPMMTNTTFTGNYADFFGGGVYNSSSSPTMTDLRFSNNTTDSGGGIANFANSYPVMTNITITDNYAGFGGGMYNYANAAPIMENVTIIDNYAEFYGGGIYNFSSSPTLTNIVIADNDANVEGGGIYNQTSSPKITNSSIVNNEAIDNGGGIFNVASSSPILSNCILWANTANVSGGIHNSDVNSEPIVTHSIIQGGNVYTGVGNINADPLFMDMNNPTGPDGIYRTADDGLSLSLCSPAIDMGTNDSIPGNINTDIANEARIYENIVDMGAYEPIWTLSFGAVPNTPNQLSEATVERTDIEGWTHYFDGNNNCEWLLSLKKGTQNIGTIGDGTFAVSHQTQADYGTGTAKDLSAAAYVASGSWYVMHRFWTVNATSQPTANVTIRFPYHSNDFNDLNGSFSVSNHEDISFYKAGNTLNPHALDIPILKYNPYENGALASTSTWIYGNPSPDVHYAEYLVSSFSGGSGGVGTVGFLPVELLYFYAMKDDESAILRWATASEENNKGFHLEHSTDGISFEKIAWVDGNGNSQQQQSYHFKHSNPVDGNNYYRLLQEDFDGTQEISQVKVLSFDKKTDINVFPNLIAQSKDTFIKFNIGKERNVTANIYNYSGQLVKTTKYLMTEGNNLKKLEVSDLPSDIYWVNLVWGKRVESFRLVIME